MSFSRKAGAQPVGVIPTMWTAAQVKWAAQVWRRGLNKGTISLTIGVKGDKGSAFVTVTGKVLFRRET